MSHLSRAEFVDAAEGALAPPRVAHLESCAACREQAARVAGAIADARGVDVPEPSPLYWPHLSARVREQVERETIAPAWRAGSWREIFALRRLVPVASALVFAAAAIVSGVMPRGRHVAVPVAPASVAAAVSADPAAPPDDSEAWEVLTSAAAETPIEDAHAAGMGVPAGAVDRAVQRMTPEELNALGELLQSELRRSGD
jgi:hypothetical protein